MKINKVFAFLGVLIVFTFIPSITLADTEVFGETENDQVWTKSAGPYYVTDLFIPPNIKVDVEAGTEIFVDGYIAVFGTMNLNGEEGNKVLMNLNPNALSWYIHVDDGAKIEFTNSIINQVDGITASNGFLKFLNVYILDAFSGIIGMNHSVILAENLNIAGLIEGTSIMALDSTINLTQSSIEDALDGSNYTIAGYSNSVVNVSNTEILPIFGVSLIMLGGDLTLDNVRMIGGDDDGIQLIPYYDYVNNNYVSTKANIINSTISNFSGDGIFAIDPDMIITGSNITGNYVGIESYARNNFSISVASSTMADNATGIIFGSQNALASINYDVRNNWWGDATGPLVLVKNENGMGDSIIAYNSAIENIQFSPWLVSSPDNELCCSSVIFLPGLESSRLYKQEVFENQLWEPNRNLDVEKLYLNISGLSIENNIYTRDIVDRTNIGLAVGLPNLDKDIYKNFSLSMDSLVTDEFINEWKSFPYDWRFNYDDLINNGVKLQSEIMLIIPEIERLASESKTGNVTIITHSNGGLFAKVLTNKLSEIGKENLVDKIIMVAAPQLGTPTAVGALLHGDEQKLGGGLLMNHETARGLAENMKPAYNMLPSEKYFENVLEPVVTFDSSLDRISNFRTKYGDNINSYSVMKDFVLGTKDGRVKPGTSDIVNPNILNAPMVLGADTLHDELDSWVPPENVKLTEIAGWGLNTTKGYKYVGREGCLPGSSICVTTLDHELIKSIDGDGTVLSPSAVSGSGDKYYVNIGDYNLDTGNNNDHKAILEISRLEDFIKNIIQGNPELPEYITSDKPIDTNNSNIRIAMHSPVSIDAYDSLGNHTGIVKNPDPNSDMDFVESNIPNSSYEEVGEGKYIYINGEDDPTIKLQGLGSGTFTLNISESNNGVVSELNFVDIPTSSNMEGQIIVGATSISLMIDVEGDGLNDVVIKPNQDLDPIVYLNIIKKTLDGFDISPKIKNAFIKRIDAIIKSIEKGKVKNTLKKIKDFNKKLKSLSKKKLNKHHHKKINKDDAQIFMNMLNQLLDLLESK